MPDNPEAPRNRPKEWATELRLRWYWFNNNNNVGTLLACFFAGVLAGLWFS